MALRSHLILPFLALFLALARGEDDGCTLRRPRQRSLPLLPLSILLLRVMSLLRRSKTSKIWRLGDQSSRGSYQEISTPNRVC